MNTSEVFAADGINNAPCQAMRRAASWFDWNLLSKHANVLRFVKLLIQRRVMREVEHERWRLSLSQFLREAKLAWHGVKLSQSNGAQRYWFPVECITPVRGRW